MSDNTVWTIISFIIGFGIVGFASLVGYLLEGGDAPVVFVQRWTDGTTPDEVVDGLQRLTAIVRFGRNEIPLETEAGERQYLSEFSTDDQRMILGQGGIALQIRYVQCRNLVEVISLYLRLNRGGTPHTDAEIERVEALRALLETK